MSTESLSTEYWVSRDRLYEDRDHDSNPHFNRVYLADDIDTKFAALRAENGKLGGDVVKLIKQTEILGLELNQRRAEVATRGLRVQALENALIKAKYALLYLSPEAREEIASELGALI